MKNITNRYRYMYLKWSFYSTTRNRIILFSRKLGQIEIILSETSKIQTNTTFYLVNPVRDKPTDTPMLGDIVFGRAFERLCCLRELGRQTLKAGSISLERESTVV